MPGRCLGACVKKTVGPEKTERLHQRHAKKDVHTGVGGKKWTEFHFLLPTFYAQRGAAGGFPPPAQNPAQCPAQTPRKGKLVAMDHGLGWFYSIKDALLNGAAET